jgi:hypothetical protein
MAEGDSGRAKGGDAAAIWPQRRPDGSASITTRFASDHGLSFDELSSFLETWLEQRSDAQRAGMERDLAEAPNVVDLGANAAEITINTKPERGYWARDWLVVLGRAVEEAFPDATLLGFYDTVAGQFRPVSGALP